MVRPPAEPRIGTREELTFLDVARHVAAALQTFSYGRGAADF
jgi:hypothetical protein